MRKPGDSDLLGGRAHLTANWTSFICSMLHTGYKVIGYMFAKQSYRYKLRGLLFKPKAILLVQMARAFVQTSVPAGFSALLWAFYWVYIDWLAHVTQWGRGIPPFHGNRNPSPGCLPAQPQQPHKIKLISQLQKPTRKISDA